MLLTGGTFLSGGLYLKSDVILEVDVSAVLKASGEISDYGADTHHNRYRNEEALDRLEKPEGISSENYYPDWSRAVFLDCRNVRNLVAEDLVFHKIYPDERDDFIIEKCAVMKQEIYLQPEVPVNV